ncbi:MAG: HAD family hydrolase [Erysipelotrichaceae bacterium]|nr:HAD family hydrolase [Erysipelotrichaceae bacterium]
MKEIKAYLFDMDGTLANSEKYYCDHTYNALKKYAYDRDYQELCDNFIGCTDDESISYLEKVFNVDRNRAEEIFRDIYDTSVVDYKDYIFPDALETLNELKKRGYKLAMCTMNYQYNVESFLKNGFEDVFDLIFSAYELKLNPKPSPDVYNLALKELGLNSDEVIVVEDSYNGILAGKSAGAYVIANKESGFIIDTSKADKCIDNLIELIR